MALWIKSTLFSKTRQDNIHIAQVVVVRHQQHRPWLCGSNQHYLVRQGNIHIAQVVVVRHQQHRPWLCGSNQHYLVRQDNIHIVQVVVVRHQQHRPWLYEIKSTLFSKTRQYTHCAGSSGWTPATQAMALWVKSTLFSKTRQDNIHIAQVVVVRHHNTGHGSVDQINTI